jgi:hypothetical protein
MGSVGEELGLLGRREVLRCGPMTWRRPNASTLRVGVDLRAGHAGVIVRGGVQVVVAQGPALAAASRCSLRPGHWAHADPALHATPKLARWGAAPRSATAPG